MKNAYWETDFSIPIEQRIRNYYNSVTEDEAYEGFDTSPLKNTRFASACSSSRIVVWEFRVQQALCNKDGNMHGGAVSTLFDNLTSTALYTVSRPGFWDGLGVSRSLIVHFFRSIPRGALIRLECKVISTGKKMAMVEGKMKTVDGALCASALHEKVWTGSLQL